MIKIIQTIYKLIFNSTYKVTRNIPLKARNILVNVCLFILAGLFFYQCGSASLGLNPGTVQTRTVIGVIAIILVCIFSVNKKLEYVKWNPWVAYPYYIAAIIMVVTGYQHPVGQTYLEYAWMMLLVFPGLYFVLNNIQEYEKYFNILANSIAIQGGIIAFLTYFMRPINTLTCVSNRYMGLTTNPNFLGMVGLIVTTATLYLIATSKKKVPIYIVINGIFVAFIWLSVSRTALIALALQLVAWSIMVLRINFRHEKIKSLIIIGATFVILVVSVPIVKTTLTAVGTVVVPVASAEEVDSELKNRVNLTDKTIAQISSGRDFIWKEYVKHFNLWGNDYESFNIKLPSGGYIKNAHNTYIDISFRSGIIAGLAYLIFMTAVLAVMNINIFNNRNKKYMIFAVLAVIAYFIETILEVQVLPFNRGNVLIFYLALAPLWEKRGIEILKE